MVEAVVQPLNGVWILETSSFIAGAYCAAFEFPSGGDRLAGLGLDMMLHSQAELTSGVSYIA
jgi:hypothetical protein